MVTTEQDEDVPWSLPLMAEMHRGRSCVPQVEPEGASCALRQEKKLFFLTASRSHRWDY